MTQETDAARQRRTFVAQVITKCGEPGDRAAMRTALRKPYDAIPHQAHRVVLACGVPQVRADRQRAYYALAAMIAAVPGRVSLTKPVEETESRDFGRCMADAVAAGVLRQNSAESHLALLVKQSTNGLHRHLPGIVGRLADHPGGVDWVKLLEDMEWWPSQRGQIARHWLQSFYRARLHDELQRAENDDEQSMTAPDAA